MSRLAKPTSDAGSRYADVMLRVRERFEIISQLRKRPPSWSVGETIGTHLRKIVEGIAFGCVLATEHSVKGAPRNAVGQWNAENIFLALKKLGEFPYPDPNQIRHPTAEERRDHDVNVMIEGVETNRIPVDDLRKIYQRTHAWTHENNPYVVRSANDKNYATLLADVDRVERMLAVHRIGITGKSLLCTLRDSQSGDLNVIPIDKVQSI